MNGLFNEMTYFNGVAGNRRRTFSSTTTSWAARLPIRHYAAGWAVAGDTPFTWTKQVAGSYGGTRNGMVVHWPKGIKAKGEIRDRSGITSSTSRRPFSKRPDCPSQSR